MGGTSWTDSAYTSRAATRAATGKAAFAYDADIKSGNAAAVSHATLDPSKMKGDARECRDSTEHPNTTAVFVGFDVTGSMGEVPQVMQKGLPTLMGLLLRQGYLADPSICVAGIGDATCDKAPVQIGQFESGIEIENDLTNLFLEGGGGGQQTESYELALYFLARKTTCDCFEKRQKKGYAIIIGDEMAYPTVRKEYVKNIFGDGVQGDIALADILAEAQTKWEVFFVIPRMTSYYDDPKVNKFWRDLLGERFVKLQEPAAISELIASLVGVCEGTVDADDLSGILTKGGTSDVHADAVSRALVPVGKSARTDVSKLASATGLATL